MNFWRQKCCLEPYEEENSIFYSCPVVTAIEILSSDECKTFKNMKTCFIASTTVHPSEARPLVSQSNSVPMYTSHLHSLSIDLQALKFVISS